jgi:2-keto-4-pentenoate hydratase/2-oxohepta-3-ene-1,7-dioic acid hydratase in catechol pathway
MGGDRLASMAWSFAELVAYASRSAWVKAGDVIASGTCSGGALAEAWGRSGKLDPPPLKPGDVVTMTVEGIGTISNEVVDGPPEACPIPRARRLPPRGGR